MLSKYISSVKICKTGQKVMFSNFLNKYTWEEKNGKKIKLSKRVSVEVECEWLVILVPTFSAVSFCARSCVLCTHPCGAMDVWDSVWRSLAWSGNPNAVLRSPIDPWRGFWVPWGKMGPAGEALGLPPPTPTRAFPLSTLICCASPVLPRFHLGKGLCCWIKV